SPLTADGAAIVNRLTCGYFKIVNDDITPGEIIVPIIATCLNIYGSILAPDSDRGCRCPGDGKIITTAGARIFCKGPCGNERIADAKFGDGIVQRLPGGGRCS